MFMQRGEPAGWEPVQNEVNITTFLRALMQRWYLLLLCVLLGGILGYLLARMTPPLYEAKARLLIETPGSLATSQLSMLIGSSSPDISTQLEVLNTRKMLEDVRRDLGYNETYKEFSDRFRFGQARSSNIIEIAAQDHDPKKAALLANTVMQSYLHFTRELYQQNPTSIAGKLEQEIRLQERKMKGLDNRVVQFLKDKNLTLPDKEFQTYLERYSKLIERAAELRATQEGLAKETGGLRAQLAKQPDLQIVNRTFSVPQKIQFLSQRIAELQIEKSRVLSEFQSDEPEVQAVEKQLQSAQAELDKAIREQAGEQYALFSKQEAPNPIQQGLLESLLKSETEQITNQGVLDYVQGEINKIADTLKGAPEALSEFQALVRQQISSQMVWAEKIKAYEQARAQQLVGRVNPIPVENAVPPEKPIAPRPLLMTALGLMLGAMVGTVLALWREGTDIRIRDRRSAEKLIGAPVLLELPGKSTGTQGLQPLVYAFKALGGGSEWREALVVPLQPSEQLTRWIDHLQETFAPLNGYAAAQTSENLPALTGKEEPNGAFHVAATSSLTDENNLPALFKTDRFVLLVPTGVKLNDWHRQSIQWLHPRLLGVILIHLKRGEKT
jgi:succinoglycan biosynthesis transport protein ExoP